MKRLYKVLLMFLVSYGFFVSADAYTIDFSEVNLSINVGGYKEHTVFTYTLGMMEGYSVVYKMFGDQVLMHEMPYNNNATSTYKNIILIYGIKPGKCCIYATKTKTYSGAITTIEIQKINITVTGTDPTSMVMQHQLHLGIGQTHTLSPRLLPSGSSSTLTWYSSNTNVATVSGGKITAVSVGDATITCITANGLREDCEVTVTPTMASNLALNQDQLQMSVGDTFQFSTTIAPENASYKQVTWTSMNPDVVSVDANGLMSCLADGRSVVLAQTVDGSNLTAGCFVQVGLSESSDVNGDGIVNITDVTNLIDYLLNGTAPITPTGNTKTYTVNGVSFTMVNVEGGTFTMGATPEQGDDATNFEKPAHQVTLSSFSIGQTEVTQALWLAVMGTNPSEFTGNLQNPVEMVSWDDCQEFITRLNVLTGKSFRLPTEAEWEYAARGGNKSQGNKYAGSSNIDEVCWYTDNSDATTHAVATKSPNELELYDMSGNVYERCQDWYYEDYSFISGEQINPTGPDSGTLRVMRGGSYMIDANRCRVSRRGYITPTLKRNYIGLRLAL